MNVKDLNPEAVAAQLDALGRDMVRRYEQETQLLIEQAKREVELVDKTRASPSLTDLLAMNADVLVGEVRPENTYSSSTKLEVAVEIYGRRLQLGTVNSQKIFEKGAKLVLIVYPNA